MVLFVDPDGADEVAEDFFKFVMGFGVGVAGVVEDDGGATVDIDSAGVGEGAEFEDAGDSEEVVTTGVGGFAFAGELLAMLLRFGDFFVDAIAFFLDIFVREGLAVAGDGAVDTDAVDGEAFRVGGVGLLDIAFAV